MAFDFAQLIPFIQKIKAAPEQFRKDMAAYLEELGEDCLEVIRDEIVAKGNVDTHQLLESFTKGNHDNIWELNEGGLTLEIGTITEYAQWVNDGHMLNPAGEETRFVPGVWSGDKFQYDPGASGGMLLHQKFVQGSHFWEDGLRAIESVIPELVNRKVEEWLAEYFAEFL